MTKEAYIFSSKEDVPLAARCSEWMRRNGWSVSIVTDIVAPRLIGLGVAQKIADRMARSNADVVAKIDADTVLTPEALEWLSSATDHAHGFHVGPHSFAGMWAVSKRNMRLARDRVAMTEPCRCPESFVFRNAFQSVCGIRYFPAHLTSWIPGRKIPDESAGITLPSAYRGHDRLQFGLAAFRLDSQTALQ